MAEDRRFREVQRYADVHGFFAGFPNFHEGDYGDGVVYGTIFLRDTEAEWRDVPSSEYQIFHIEDVPGLFRAANDYAGRAGFPAAFPNCEQADHGQGAVYGTILMKPGTTEWRDVPRSELGNPQIDDVPAMMRAANDYSARNGFSAGFPTFHQADHGQGVVYGIVLLKPGVSTWRDVPADLLGTDAASAWAILLCTSMTDPRRRLRVTAMLSSSRKAVLDSVPRSTTGTTCHTAPKGFGIQAFLGSFRSLIPPPSC